MYQSTFIIVEIGESEEVMKIAENHGARGGTILKGRGAGAAEANKVLGMEIEPEKDVLFIIATEEITDSVVEAVSDYLDIDRVNSGILFTMDISEARGLAD